MDVSRDIGLCTFIFGGSSEASDIPAILY